MTQDDSTTSSRHTDEQQLPSADRTMVIGNRNRWAVEGRMTSVLRDFTFLNFSELTREVVFQHQPDIILSPLVGDDFDVIEVANTLQEIGYDGRYRAIADSVPNVEMIRREVSQHAESLDFDVLVMAENPQEQALRDVVDQPETAQHFPDSERRRA